jgi:hypothetical protein
MPNHVAQIARDLASILKNSEVLRREIAVDWDGTYGYNAGQAHPSVEHVACPVCGAPPGVLCMGATRRKLGRHYKRAYAYRDLKRVKTIVASSKPRRGSRRSPIARA